MCILGYSVCSIIPRYETQGTSVLLDCSIASIEVKSVEWRGPYQENTLYAESNYSNTNLPDALHDRIFVTGDHSNGHYDLRIVNAQISDEGLYRCSVQNGDTIRIFNLTFPGIEHVKIIYLHVRLKRSLIGLIIMAIDHKSVNYLC